MSQAFVAAFGAPTAITALRAERAREVAGYLASGDAVGGALHECRENEHSVTLLADIYPEIGQRLKADIRHSERVAIQFDCADSRWPLVWALRDDFPANLMHTNLVELGQPTSLCIALDDFAEVRHTLTPFALVERIRAWFQGTAHGTLHQDDQALEPFFYHTNGTVIIPKRFLAAQPLTGQYGLIACGPQQYRVVADGGTLTLALLTVTLPPRVHGPINRAPANVAQLRDLVNAVDFDLLAALRTECSKMFGQQALSGSHTTNALLIVRTPLKRSDTAEPERVDVKAFYVGDLIRFGQQLGVWAVHEGRVAPLLDRTAVAGDAAAVIAIEQYTVERTLDAVDAAAYNGIAEAAHPMFVAIGAGTLGSQTLLNLARSGMRPSAIVDHDILAPHNMARHVLRDDAIGFEKAPRVAAEINAIFPDEPPVGAIVENFGGPLTSRVLELFNNAGFILDMSASGVVARCLAGESAAPRVISIFLSPSGNDLVLFAEDAKRTIRLDEIEAQYYWHIAETPALHDHLIQPWTRRYGNGCRDRSSVIAHATVATLTGILAHAIRRQCVQPTSTSLMWRLSPDDLSVSAVQLPCEPMIRMTIGEWSCAISGQAVRDLQALRTRALPRETGGVVIGRFDLIEHRLYAAGVLGPPQDSEQAVNAFVRGTAGLEADVVRRHRITGEQLHYLGEWHAHPRGHDSAPSPTDSTAYVELSRRMRHAGYPESMIIIGDSSLTWRVGAHESTVEVG